MESNMKYCDAEIIPREGITFNGKKIPLGAHKEEIISLLGAPEFENGSLYYCGNELRFDLDADGCVEFIEFLGGIDGSLKPRIYGTDAFETF